MTYGEQPHMNGLSPAPDAVRLTLLEDQLNARNGLVDLWRQGKTSTMICAPTGSGKTVLASELMRSAYEAGSKVVFVADQVQLVKQARDTFTRYGLPVGVTQAEKFGNAMQLVVASAQTLAQEHRQPVEDPKLIIIDEAHVQHKKVLEWAKRTGARLVGLSATPLAHGLADHYESVVNVTTTNQLIEQGRLVPMRLFAPEAQVDHETIRRNRTGQYDQQESARRTSKIAGNVVAEWVERKNELFGPGVRVPTAVFTNTIEDGAAYASEFARAGYDFRQTTYKTRDRELRADILEAFERQEIDGVISCQALAKGWDSSIVMCIIDLQLNGASVMPVIQKYGRGMRIHADIDPDGVITHRPVNLGIERKEFFLLLDHVGNVEGWAGEIVDLYDRGVSDLKAAKQQYGGQRQSVGGTGDVACRGCGYLLPAGVRACPACGRERAAWRPRHEAADSTRLTEQRLQDFKTKEASEAEAVRLSVLEQFGDRPKVLWLMVCSFTASRARANIGTNRERAWMLSEERQAKFARGQFKDLTKQWPPKRWEFDPASVECDTVVDEAIRAQLRNFAIRKAKAS